LLVPILALVGAFLVILHHRIKHHHDLKGWRRWFQIKDADNHETLALFLLGVAVGAWVSMVLGE